MAKMTKKKDNRLSFWESVQTTDPKYTKEVGFGRKFTSINAQYQLREMTRAFGRIGEGWGIRNEQYYTINIEGLLCYQAQLWYDADGLECVFDISSSIATHNSKGKLDDECFKKVATDALTKGLSKLGFNADVFLGLWDDNRYVQALRDAEIKQKPKLDAVRLNAMFKAIDDGMGAKVKSKLSAYEIDDKQMKQINSKLEEAGV